MKTTTVVKGLALAGGFSAAYLKYGRSRVLNWGATAGEAYGPLAGDEILPKPALQTTRAITIDAPPAQIWPWLAQMGPKPRAGVYTYDQIERLLGINIENSDRILPEFQEIKVGEFFALNDDGKGLAVRDVEPGKHLVLQWEPAKSTWAFCLEPEAGGNATRLISRNRIPGSGPFFWLMAVGLMEFGSLVMERKMLKGIKQRAERPKERGAASVAAKVEVAPA